MKLISVQSRGNRLISAEVNDMGWCYLRLAKMGKKKFKSGEKYRFYDSKQALVAAETWLKGATI